jgi:hypothetical protein
MGRGVLRISSCCKTSYTEKCYTRAVSQQKREASLKVVELMLPLDLEKFQHPSAPSQKSAENRSTGKSLSRKDLLVDLIGIEPMTSFMPSSGKL